MRLRASQFHLQKGGNSPAEFEDAYNLRPETGRFAIADGATDSYDSGRWASMLTEAFTSGRMVPSGIEQFDLVVESLSREWKTGIDWARLPWYKEEKAGSGAFSTFLGLAIELPGSTQPRTESVSWHAVAVGDACLFHIRNDILLPPSFPIANSKEFGSTPPLISTDRRYNQYSLKKLERTEGRCQNGDTFLLATDALAQWIVRSWEEGKKPWNEPEMTSSFEEFITTLRNQRVIGNDDVTLLVIGVEEGMAKPGLAEPTRITLYPAEEIVSAKSARDSKVKVQPQAKAKPGEARENSHSVKIALLIVLVVLEIVVLMLMCLLSSRI